jgi:glycine oxidase
MPAQGLARRTTRPERTETALAERIQSRSEAAVDVVVVGAGVIGLACAWRAAQAGLSVRVLERDEPGAGASGVAAGMLAPVGEAAWGEEDLLRAALAAHGMWAGFAAQLEDAAGSTSRLLASGALHVALDRDEAAELRRRHELMRSLGLDAEWLTGRACRELEPGLAPGAVGGVHAPHEAAVDPGAAVSALVAACARAGVDVRAGSEVDGLLMEGERAAGVTVSSGARHPAGAVVAAAGAWSGLDWLPEEARPPVRPVKGQILTLRGPAGRPVAGGIVVTERVYLVPRPDGRLVAGATVEELGFDTTVTAGGVHELLREAYRALPDIAELELERAVAGLRPGTPDNAPIVGRSAVEGLILATGHYRNGVLLAPLTAAGVAAVLTGDALPAELEVADPGRFTPHAEAVR